MSKFPKNALSTEKKAKSIDEAVELALTELGIEKENEEDTEFIEFIKNYRLESRPIVLALLRQYEHKKIYIFKERSEAEEFLIG